MTTTKKASNIRMSPRLVARLDLYADTKNVSRNTAMTTLMSWALDQQSEGRDLDALRVLDAITALSGESRTWVTREEIRESTGFKDEYLRERLADLMSAERVDDDGLGLYGLWPRVHPRTTTRPSERHTG